MSKSRKRRKSSVNEAYLIVIAICALSFVVAIKQIFISISTSLANLSSLAQLSLIIVTTISVALVLYLKAKHINFRYKNRHFSSVDYMKLSEHEFEQFCSDVLNTLGYRTKVTKAKCDGVKICSVRINKEISCMVNVSNGLRQVWDDQCYKS